MTFLFTPETTGVEDVREDLVLGIGLRSTMRPANMLGP